MELIWNNAQSVATILAVIVVWLLGRQTRASKIRFEKKMRLAQVLYLLLRVERQFALTTIVRERLRVVHRKPLEYLDGFGAVSGLGRCVSEGIAKDLEKAVERYSVLDPVGAFKSHGLQFLLPAVESAVDRMTGAGMNWSDMPLLDEIADLRRRLRKLIRAVALRHGLSTRLRVWRLLRKLPEKEIDDRIKQYPDAPPHQSSPEIAEHRRVLLAFIEQMLAAMSSPSGTSDVAGKPAVDQVSPGIASAGTEPGQANTSRAA